MKFTLLQPGAPLIFCLAKKFGKQYFMLNSFIKLGPGEIQTNDFNWPLITWQSRWSLVVKISAPRCRWSWVLILLPELLCFLISCLHVLEESLSIPCSYHQKYYFLSPDAIITSVKSAWNNSFCFVFLWQEKVVYNLLIITITRAWCLWPGPEELRQIWEARRKIFSNWDTLRYLVAAECTTFISGFTW